MALPQDMVNATVSLTRRGTGNLVTGVNAYIASATFLLGPEGPIEQRAIYLDPLNDASVVLAAGDSVVIFSRVGHPTIPPLRGTVAFVDTPSDSSGDLALLKLTVLGGFLPA